MKDYNLIRYIENHGYISDEVKDIVIDLVKQRNENRNKAIDETIEKIKNWLYENNGLSILDVREINEIAEQLKGGAVDGKS